MLLKLIFFSVLLFETINATAVKKGDKTNSFSVERTWKSYQKYCTCQHNEEYDEWKEGIQEYYDGCRSATYGFVGPSYKIADNVVNALEGLFSKLIQFTNINSTVLTPNSKSILEALSSCNKLDDSGLNIIREFNKVQLNILSDFKEIVDNLKEHIGDLTCPINDALSDLGFTFWNYMTRFIFSGFTKYKTQVDYEPTLKKFQQLMNTVALVSETLLNECEAPTPQVEEAVTVLHLLNTYYAIVVQGVYSCALDTLYRQKCDVSERLAKCSVSLDYVVVEVTQSIISIGTPISKGIIKPFTNIVNIAMSFNKTVKDILGLFEGTSVTVGNIKECLTKGGTMSAETRGRRVLKGVNTKSLRTKL